MIRKKINSKIFKIDKYKGQEYNLENESGIDIKLMFKNLQLNKK